MPETDRLQVPLGIHENNFGNIAIRTWNRYNVMDIECDMCEIAMGVELQQHHNASMLMHITTTLCAYYSCKYNNVWHVSYIYIFTFMLNVALTSFCEYACVDNPINYGICKS